jgi:hypothetical protein
MPSTIFWSWQSDRPHRETRGVIREALEAAVVALSSEVQDADRPDETQLAVDHDTKGVAGSPDIAATILRKIETASLFVADVTPIAMSSPLLGRRPKHIANPNVLIELGYAKKALSPERVIQVWNTAFTNCGPDDLPFDMRGRRGPISFVLEEGASKDQLRAVREMLTRDLKEAIQAVIRTLPQPKASSPPWYPNRVGDSSVWFPPNHKFLINEPDHGSGRKTTPEAPTSFVRVLPSSWTGSDDLDLHDLLLWSGGGLSWGDTAEGILTYPGSVMAEGYDEVPVVTIRFPGTGEVWAINRSISGDWEGLPRVDADGVLEGWARYLRYSIPTLIGRGGVPPIMVRVGASGLHGLHWPTRQIMGTATVALANEVTHEFAVPDGDVESLVAPLTGAWNVFRRRFSQPTVNEVEVEKYLRRWR